jgi:hypothetical protein
LTSAVGNEQHPRNDEKVQGDGEKLTPAERGTLLFGCTFADRAV